jgi:uncharacterized protein (TIGR02145 family)
MKNLLKLIIIGLLISVIFSGCTSKEVKKAKQFMEASMYEQAISLLEIEIQDNPKNAEASYLLGKCYLQTSNQSKVEECFKRAILLKTDYKQDIGNIYYEKSLELFKGDNNRYANAYYEEGLKYNPIAKENFAKRLFDYVSEYSESSIESTKSINLFKIVIQISPNYKPEIAEKTFALAKLFIGKGFGNEGFAYADFGINYDPKHIKDVSILYFDYANELITVKNRPNDCFSYFERCMQLDPSRRNEIGNIYYNQAKEFEAKNETSLLLVFAKKSAEINNNYNSWYLNLKDKYEPKLPVTSYSNERLEEIYETNSFTDSRDGQKYRTVKIGSQIWMAENLKATIFNDGTPIPEVPDYNIWVTLKSPAYTWYDGTISNRSPYGALYNHYSVSTGKLCPTGWHVPSDEEWKTLEISLGMTKKEADKTGWRGTDQGTQMKSTSGWNEGGNGSNTSGFTALPSGGRYSSSAGSMGNICYWITTDLTYRALDFSHSQVNRYYDYENAGLGVRCIKNK